MRRAATRMQGDGVVGLQPVIEAGESFDYNSGTWLNHPSGIMFGTYTMQNQDGDEFDIKIPAFS